MSYAARKCINLMAYQSLYRKYRPQTFSDVVGQQHVVRTLQNALKTGRVGHGYLFTGTRGTAKTTVARLLAKALNCESAQHYVPEPCDSCESCRRITAGTCIDVVELDAASHRGVADIEEVRKAVGYGPMQHRFKVYIIDEAHQLSSDAKDAFLKTLEEPPANVVFILATTEPQSIPITIRSRCQQFDFHRGTIADISGRLRFVLASENRTMDEAAVLSISRAAEGSYRDSLSLLEQVLGFKDGNVVGADVEAVLGLLESDHLQMLTSCLATNNMAQSLALASEILDTGKDARSILRSVATHMRDVLVFQLSGPSMFTDRTELERGSLRDAAEGVSKGALLAALDITHKALADLRWNQQHRLVIEIAFAKMCQPVLQASEATARSVAASVSSAVVSPPLQGRATSHARPESMNPATSGRLQQQPQGSTLQTDGTVSVMSTSTPSGTAPVVSQALAALRASRITPAQGPSVHAEAQPNNPVDAMMQAAVIGTNGPEEAGAISGLPGAITSAWSLEDVLKAWPSFLSAADIISKRAGVMLAAAQPISAKDGVVTISFLSAAHKDMMSDQKQTDFIRKVLGRVLGLSEPIRGVLFTLEVQNSTVSSGENNDKFAIDVQDDSSRASGIDDEAIANKHAPESPLLREVLEVFGGKLVEQNIQ